MAAPPRPKAPEQHAEQIVLGEIVGVHGVRGAVKVYSWTRPRTNILDYPHWQLDGEAGSRKLRLTSGREQGKGIVAQLEGIADRDAAYALQGSKISVERTALPKNHPGEYYWVELQGLAVETTQGKALGEVSGLMETGANDVLVVKGDRERLIPFVPDLYIQSVDLAAGRMIVDWDPEF